MNIPADRLHHMTLVVRDAREAAAKMARIYGVGQWEVVQKGPERLSETLSHGFRTSYRFLTATGAAETEDGPVTFQLVQPQEGWTIYQEWLITRGEGVAGVCVAEVTPAEYAELRLWLEAEGVEIAQRHIEDGVVERVHLDTRDALGGFYTELIVAHDPAWREKLRIDERWDLSDLAPAGGAPLPLNAFRHFGVVVRDLVSTLRGWNRLFGCMQFRCMNWKKAPDSLVDPIYNGAPVDHEYFTSTPTIGHMLSFELIQPTFGPSHYKEDYLLPLGEGIHHLFTTTTTAEAWSDLEARMAAQDAPVCMGGKLGSFAAFYYLDTRRALPGYVTEVLYRGPNAPPPGVSPFTPVMELDLSRPA